MTIEGNFDLADIKQVAENLDEAGKRDLMGGEPLKTLVECVTNSVTSYLVRYKGKPVALFGISEWPNFTHVGCPWLMCAEGFPKVSAARSMYEWDHKLTKPYAIVMNAMHRENKTHLKWVERLGYRQTGAHGEQIMFSRVNSQRE